MRSSDYRIVEARADDIGADIGAVLSTILAAAGQEQPK